MSSHPEASACIRSKGEGRGLFSERVFLPGETILTAKGVMQKAPSLGSLQVGPDRHLVVPEGASEADHPWRFLEHACRPNAAFKGRRLVALEPIEPEDELTFDYETTEWELASPFACACTSMGCTGRQIRGFRHLSREERMRGLPQLRDDLRRLALDAHPARLAEHPLAVALDVPPGPTRTERVTWTYAELDAAADRLAAELGRFVEGECVVAVMLPRSSPWLFAAELATLRAGAAWTAIDRSAAAAHVQYVFADARPTAVIADEAGCRMAIAAGFDAARCIDPVLLTVDKDAPRGAPERSVQGDTLAYVIYTSGSTGHPKGVLLEHAGLSNLVASDVERYDLGPGDRIAQGSSHAYDSSVEETWLAFATGATLVVMDDEVVRRGPDLVDWLRMERITVLCPTPTLLRTMGCEDPRAALPDVRLIYTGGEALEKDVAERWAPGRRLENGYGPTECTVTVLRARIEEGGDIPIGRAVPGHRAFVLDEHLEEVPVGAEGELCIRGVGLARGYLNLPELTAARFPTHPRFGRIYRTGDLVRRDAEGNHYYLGRLDDQVQLRGHRVELGAVDAVLATCPGVREAACRLQGTGAAQVLAAFVVATDRAHRPRWQDLEPHLLDRLPAHMVPARFAVLDRLPTLASGKLDRRSLPELDAPLREADRPRTAPRDAIEQEIAAALGKAITVDAAISVDDDFFLDLGGNSVGAARLVSALRSDPRTAALTVRDVYEARTVAGLAACARNREDTATVATAGPALGKGRPRLMTAVQVLWLLSGLALAAPVIYVIWFLFVPWWLGLLGIVPAMVLTPVLLLVVATLFIPLMIALAALAKWILIGRYRPMRAPAWGSFHLRQWMVESLTGLVPWGFLQDTVFLNTALRALGARVGKRVHIHRGVDIARGGWDLLEIGDDATIGQDASLRTITLDDGHLVVGPVTIGARATIETRGGMDPGTTLEDDACLGALSWLPAGETVSAGERWSGVPAMPRGEAASPPALRSDERVFDPYLHGVLTIIWRFALATGLYLLAVVVPAIVAIEVADISVEQFLGWLYEPTNQIAGPLSLMVFAVTTLIVATLLSGLGTRWLGRVRAGVRSRWGLGYLHMLAKRDAVAATGSLLSGTLLWPKWLRLAGMRIGRDCEVSSIVDVVPESVELGEGSFLADGIYLGGGRVQHGTVELGRTRLGSGTFLGNHVVVPTGTALPDDVLIGSATVTGGAAIRPGSAWFGHPIFELPRREVVTMDRQLTHEPGWIRRTTRWTWELARFLLPIPPLFIFFAWLGTLKAAWGGAFTASYVLGVVPAATAAAALALVMLVVAMKWVLVGRVRPGQHALWSCWCSRWDFLYVAWAAWCRPILALLEGTLLLVWPLRLFGARIGRRVLLGRGFAQIVDPDMIHIGDGATASPLYQAHSFEDRVLKIDYVRVAEGATIGPGAILFYGAQIETKTHVAPQAVVMKHEHLLAGTAYAGAPAGPRRRAP